MLCPECFTTWIDEEDFIVHLQKHGRDPWRCKQLAKDLKLVTEFQRHSPSMACKCPMWGVRFECEMRVYGDCSKGVPKPT